MKKAIVTCFISCIFASLVFSQNGGGSFLKRVEYNILIQGDTSEQNPNRKGLYNLSSKGDVEKLFFGDFNAPVEFFFNPSSESVPLKGPTSGFRIMRDSLDKSCILEVKFISNYKEADEAASAKYPSIGIPVLDAFRLSEDSINKIAEYNRATYTKQSEERIKLYKVETLSFFISDQFAEKMHEKMTSVINNFKAKGILPIINDSFSVTFRTVVDDEVWTLTIHAPKGDIVKMSDLCRQIVADAKNNQLDEQKYISALAALEN